MSGICSCASPVGHQPFFESPELCVSGTGDANTSEGGPEQVDRELKRAQESHSSSAKTLLLFTQHFSLATKQKLSIIQQDPDALPIALASINFYLGSVLAKRYPHVARRVALGELAVPTTRRRACRHDEMHLLVETRLTSESAQEVLPLPSLPLSPTRAQRGQMVTSLPAPSPSEAFFGLLSRHALIPHTEAVNKAEETSQRLRKEAGGSRVAVIGVVVRGALLELDSTWGGGRANRTRSKHQRAMLADSGLLQCVKLARHTAVRTASCAGSVGAKSFHTLRAFTGVRWCKQFQGVHCRRLGRHLLPRATTSLGERCYFASDPGFTHGVL